MIFMNDTWGLNIHIFMIYIPTNESTYQDHQINKEIVDHTKLATSHIPLGDGGVTSLAPKGSSRKGRQGKTAGYLHNEVK